MIGAWSKWEGRVVNDEFQLQKYLGGSKYSAVFLTERRGPEPAPAAIKLVPADEANARKYLFRWDLAARLSHPHLIRLLQQGRCRLGEEDLLYVVMEYAEENLAEVLPQRSLTPAEVRDLLEPTLDALNYLHGRGFVHGHLKPANVLATKDQLKLASDGLCRPGAAAPVPEKLAPYDPPEKASGATLPAADLWSLGMTITEALTQHLPAWNENETADPVVPETLPAPLLDIVRGCLRRDPQRRLTIADIRARLHQPASSLPKPTSSPHTGPAAIEPQPGPSKRSLVAPLIVVLAEIKARLQQSAFSLPKPTPSPQKGPAAIEPLQELSKRSLIAPLIVVLAEIKARLQQSAFSLPKPTPSPQTGPAGIEPLPELSKRSLIAPLIVVLAAVVFFSGLGLLRRQSHAPQQDAATRQELGQNKSSAPATRRRVNLAGNSVVTGSHAKPSPASRGGEAAQLTDSPTASNPVADVHPAAGNTGALREILPDIPQAAKATIQGTVRVGVKVHVDPDGNVAGAELDTPGPSRYFARLATEAAQNWKFAPIGQDQERQFVVHFDFTNSEIRASATQLP